MWSDKMAEKQTLHGRVEEGFRKGCNKFKYSMARFVPVTLILPLIMLFSIGSYMAIIGPVFKSYQKELKGRAEGGFKVYCGDSALVRIPNTTNIHAPLVTGCIEVFVTARLALQS